MELCQLRRGELDKIEYLSPERVELHYLMPLAEVVVDFFDQLKSRSQGYASLDYEPAGYRRSNLVKVDLLLNGVTADAFSTIVHRDKAYEYGRQMTEKLQKLIPRQLFDVPIQAAIGGKVIARETVQGQAQGRTRQVLRRRHHPQAQAAGEAEGGQEEDEVDRPGRGPRRRLHLGPQARLTDEHRIDRHAARRRRRARAGRSRLHARAGTVGPFRSLRHRNARVFFAGMLVSNDRHVAADHGDVAAGVPA